MQRAAEFPVHQPAFHESPLTNPLLPVNLGPNLEDLRIVGAVAGKSREQIRLVPGGEVVVPDPDVIGHELDIGVRVPVESKRVVCLRAEREFRPVVVVSLADARG